MVVTWQSYFSVAQIIDSVFLYRQLWSLFSIWSLHQAQSISHICATEIPESYYGRACVYAVSRYLPSLVRHCLPVGLNRENHFLVFLWYVSQNWLNNVSVTYGIQKLCYTEALLLKVVICCIILPWVYTELYITIFFYMNIWDAFTSKDYFRTFKKGSVL